MVRTDGWRDQAGKAARFVAVIASMANHATADTRGESPRLLAHPSRPPKLSHACVRPFRRQVRQGGDQALAPPEPRRVASPTGRLSIALLRIDAVQRLQPCAHAAAAFRNSACRGLRHCDVGFNQHIRHASQGMISRQRLLRKHVEGRVDDAPVCNPLIRAASSMTPPRHTLINLAPWGRRLRFALTQKPPCVARQR